MCSLVCLQSYKAFVWLLSGRGTSDGVSVPLYILIARIFPGLGYREREDNDLLLEYSRADIFLNICKG